MTKRRKPATCLDCGEIFPCRGTLQGTHTFKPMRPEEPAKQVTERTTWDVFTYDVWGNREDGYDVNDRYRHSSDHLIRCKVGIHNEGKPGEFASASPSDYQIQKLFGVRCAIETDGDDLSIYVKRASDWYPIGELLCTSHESLSPIRRLKEER